jgi:hypothetical protein
MERGEYEIKNCELLSYAIAISCEPAEISLKKYPFGFIHHKFVLTGINLVLASFETARAQ